MLVQPSDKIVPRAVDQLIIAAATPITVTGRFIIKNDKSTSGQLKPVRWGDRCSFPDQPATLDNLTTSYNCVSKWSTHSDSTVKFAGHEHFTKFRISAFQGVLYFIRSLPFQMMCVTFFADPDTMSFALAVWISEHSRCMWPAPAVSLRVQTEHLLGLLPPTLPRDSCEINPMYLTRGVPDDQHRFCGYITTNSEDVRFVRDALDSNVTVIVELLCSSHCHICLCICTQIRNLNSALQGDTVLLNRWSVTC